MDRFDPNAKKWLSDILSVGFKANKHIHSHQDEVYKIETQGVNYYLKISATLQAERDNLKKLETSLNVPKVIHYYTSDQRDYLLLSELPGKDLVELIKEWGKLKIVDMFAEAVKRLHGLDVTKIFPEADSHDVLIHGDMALPNIIISEQQKIGYIDFGRMSFGSQELDLADAIWSLQRNIGPDYGELFLKKYGSVHVTPKIKEALNFRYAAGKELT